MTINALFLNHAQQNCGVHEYGKILAEKLAASDDFNLSHLEVSSEKEFREKLQVHSATGTSVCFVNFHPQTMPWLTQKLVQSVDRPVIGIMHEFGYWNAFYEGSHIFDFRALIDPSVRSRVSNVTVHPRALVRCTPSTRVRDDITVGSFGFGTSAKCFDHIVTLVKREFDRALIRFNIPPGFFCDADGFEARRIADECRSLVAGTNISLEINHDFLSREKVVDFLAENTINLFAYTDDRGRGISSAVDFAVASGRPFGVSDGTMFRHLRYVCPEVFISKHGIRGILDYGDEPVKRLRTLWSDRNVVDSFRSAACNALEAFQAYRRRDRSFNTVLDDIERDRYSADIADMNVHAAELMGRKISRANVQQAFVKHAVEHFAGGKKSLNILCVGSFEDTAYETLRKKGYAITAIDPALNTDLNGFFHRKSTAKSSFDIIFSTSVIEHVEDDELFISQVTDLLAVGGVAVLTADFCDTYTTGDVKPHTDCRLYTLRDILLRLVPLMTSCQLVGPHFWQRSSPDFEFEGARYSFISLVFRKLREQPEDTAFSDAMREERLRYMAALVPSLITGNERLKAENNAYAGRSKLLSRLTRFGSKIRRLARNR